MHFIEQFVKLFVIFLNITIINSTIINGYFYNIFPESEISTKDIIESYFENHKNEFKINSDINLKITISNSTNFKDYIEEVKKEITQSKYHIFLIDYNTLFSDYSYYKDGDYDLLSDFNEKDIPEDYERMDIQPKKLNTKDFYTYTIPLNKYLRYDDEKSNNPGYINYRIYEDCELNDNYYAYPFSASYDLLFYNKNYFKKLGIDFNKLENWNDVKNIISEYQQKVDNTKYGINMGLNSPEEFIAFLLEYFHIINNKSYNECATGYLQNKNSIKSNEIKYYDYYQCGLGYEIFYENDIEKEKSSHIFKSINDLLKNKIINPNSLSYNGIQALDHFLNEESIFFKGNYTSFMNIVKRVYLSSNNTNLSSNSFRNSTTIKSILQNVTISTEDIFKESDKFGVTIIPGGYSTYDGYALIGNNHADFNQLYYDITQIIILLTSEYAQVDRAVNYDMSPAFNYNNIIEESISSMCQYIPCNIYKKIKSISLTKTFSSKASSTNNNIIKNMDGIFRKYYNEDDDILLDNELLDRIKILLTIHHMKWYSFICLFTIILGIFGVLQCIFLIIFIFKNRKNEILKESYPIATIIYIYGISYFFIIIIADTLGNSINLYSHWMAAFYLHFHYYMTTIAYSAYFYKLWNVNIKFNQEKFIRCGINFSKIPITFIIFAVIFFEFFMIILLNVLSPLELSIYFYYNKSINKYERLPMYYSDYYPFFVTVLNYIVFILLFLNCFFIFMLRNVKYYFNEYKPFIYSVIIVFIGYFIESTGHKFNEEVQQSIHCSIYFFTGIIFLILTVLPKVIEVKQKKIN
ncbi:hypothetical protein BCR32DRAFT_268673 [Anaeromyces robustus]|uniref:G-protein coupled receptors family 3 profile domain-containing protein n=1 Tax=Anaeromyces robustus TaxID=1754192 RepID=A0A1Y1X529_9FUNG|nr:hypothetical protein BCR32DRAFT_268673 [Anaeromyces robustus]|eukprot:ORX80758.1 hypothetical protein BCR32DRAFT_268673 [Anaeromyces robustus]